MSQAQSQAFVGNVSNPITAARIDRSISLSALAKKLGLSKQYLSRAEKGTYSALNPDLIQWTAEATSINKRDVIRRYENFQVATRRNTIESLGPQMLKRREGNTEPGHQIFTRWREGYWSSVTAFSNAFCVHPEMVRTYEDGIREQMPEPVFKALSQVNLIDPNWIDGGSRGEALRARLRA